MIEVTMENELNNIVYTQVKRAEYPEQKPAISDEAQRKELADLKAEKIKRPATKKEYLDTLARLEKEIADIAVLNKQNGEETASSRKAIDDKFAADIAALKQDESNQWTAVRAVRTKLLTDCDWTQIPDVPLTDEQRKAWQEYRQALRDIPQQLGDQDAIKIDDLYWPECPV